MITLTKEQELAIQTVKQKIKDRQPIITIAGYAGTGKTTLVKYIIEALNLGQDQVAFACFTGKASLVLQQKGIPATTLHSLLYISYLNREGSFTHVAKKELEFDYKLIVIDEISMVSNDILEAAKQHGIPIIALGDIGQLPPIGADNGLLQRPDIMLTEVLRQEAENPIIKLSMDIREGKALQKQKNDSIMIIDKTDLVDGMFSWADQVLCGYNETRTAINNQIRRGLGYTDFVPSVGEKIICLKNYWNTSSDKQKLPLINGSIGFVDTVHFATDKEVILDFAPDYADDVFKRLNTDLMPFQGKPPQNQWVSGRGKRPKMRDIKTFDWAYAITTHKSQGSQFGKVLVFEEKLNELNHKKWLYTAVTRAIDKIIIVRN
jgi:exodeoxyribonuclease-5